MRSFDEIVRRLNAADPRAAQPGDAEGSRAAVAAVIRSTARGEILFIRRAEREGDPWSGHMAFPGGRREPSDATLLDTAMRETREEVGLDLRAHARPIARLADVKPYSTMPHRLTVTAFVFVLDTDAELTPNDEVSEVVWAPLDEVLRGDRATTFHYQNDALNLVLPAIEVGATPRVVWGLTYRLLELLREALA